MIKTSPDRLDIKYITFPNHVIQNQRNKDNIKSASAPQLSQRYLVDVILTVAKGTKICKTILVSQISFFRET